MVRKRVPVNEGELAEAIWWRPDCLAGAADSNLRMSRFVHDGLAPSIGNARARLVHPHAVCDGGNPTTKLGRCHASGELIGTTLDSFLLAAEIECLTEEVTLRADFGKGATRAGRGGVVAFGN